MKEQYDTPTLDVIRFISRTAFSLSDEMDFNPEGDELDADF